MTTQLSHPRWQRGDTRGHAGQNGTRNSRLSEATTRHSTPWTAYLRIRNQKVGGYRGALAPNSRQAFACSRRRARIPALPFCRLRLKAKRTDPRYPRELRTLGDHIRKRRIELG